MESLLFSCGVLNKEAGQVGIIVQWQGNCSRQSFADARKKHACQRYPDRLVLK